MGDTATFLYTLAEMLVNAVCLLVGEAHQKFWIVRTWKNGRMSSYQVVIMKLPEPIDPEELKTQAMEAVEA